MRTQVIVIANQKGGVGKTTTAVSLSACLARLDRRVLLIDIDSQANATSGLGFEKTAGESVYAPLLGNGNLRDKIKSSEVTGLDIIPSEMDLCGADVELSGVDDHLMRLKNSLAPIIESKEYDLILVDCPPSLSILTFNALAAADWLLIPLQSEYYALEGIATIKDITSQIKDSGVNPKLEILGVLMTMYDGRVRLARQVVEEVQNHFGDLVFDTIIPRNTRLAEAPSHGRAIIDYDPYSAGSAAYEVLAEELLMRLKERTARVA